MSVCLRYVPSSPLSADVQSELCEAAVQVRGLHLWWCEPPKFFSTPERGFWGMNKIFLSGYSLPDGGYVEVADTEDTLMAWNDCRIIASQLAEWARKYGICWHLSIESDQFGSVNPSGEWSPELVASLEELKQMSGFAGAGEELERKVTEIDSRHSARNE